MNEAALYTERRQLDNRENKYQGQIPSLEEAKLT